MLDAETPALTVATRGMVFAHLTVRTGERNAHSGMYGGAALNALHALHTTLAAVLPIPAQLREGVEPPSDEERAAWASLPGGAEVLAEAGAVPADEDAVAEFYERTTADASLDVHRIEGGQTRTIVPPEARCDLSVRLAPGQDPPRSRPRSRSCCAARCPPAPSSSSRPVRPPPRASTPPPPRCGSPARRWDGPAAASPR